MDRAYHKKHVPQCPRQAAIVDQYMWAEKDTNKYRCYNGISHPIYDCKGQISYSLPLEEYPQVGKVHPQIGMTRKMHLNWREDPNKTVPLLEGFNFPNQDLSLNRTEGFYSGPLPRPGMHISTDMTPGYPLPNPYGNNRGCSACNTR